MKLTTLPVKRRHAAKSLFKRLSAVTGNRKQRVAATASADMDIEDSGSKISRALTIIFLIHIVAIGLIFIHKQFLNGRPYDEAAKPKSATGSANVAVAAPLRDLGLPKLSPGDRSHVVVQGDNYLRIAQAEGVDEQELRVLNKQAEIRPGLVIPLPPKRVVAVESPEVTAIRENTPTDRERGLVEVAVEEPEVEAPRAQLIRPGVRPATTVAAVAAPAAVVVSGKSYTFQRGDSIWGIANRFKVSQDQLMRANGISNPRKIKTGMKLVIPRA